MSRCFDETWFYAPVEREGEPAVLSSEEAHHATRALRLKVGDELVVSNGQGSVFLCKLLTESGRIDVLERIRHEPEPPGISVAIGVLKGRDVEQPVEAVCEFAVSNVYLLRTDYSSEFDGQGFDRLMERLRHKSLTALKQAKKTWLTRIHPPEDLGAWRQHHANTALMLAHPGEDTVPSPLPASMHVLVGPEGGFSKAELDYLFAQKNVYQLSLGETRLRAIHAPVAALGKLLGRK